MTRVIYITGWGRSGTTLFGRALASTPGVASVGEVRLLPDRASDPLHLCECGEALPACPLWSRVLRDLDDASVDLSAVAAAFDECLRPRRFVGSAIATRRHRPSPALATYGDFLARTFRAVSEELGVTHVVDTSKVPTIPLALAAARLPTTIVHLVRDPRAVAFSWARRRVNAGRGSVELMERYGPVASTRRWVTWNLLGETAASASGSEYVRVRYEDLVADPRRELERVFAAACLDRDLLDTIVDGDGTLQLRPTHMVDGNPNRLRHGPTPIISDDEWQTAQGWPDRLAVTTTSLAVLHRYGYRIS